MSPPLNWREFKQLLPHVDATIEFALARAIDPKKWEQIVAAIKLIPSIDDARRDSRFEDFRFSSEDCINYVSSKIGMTYPTFIEETLNALVKTRLLHAEKEWGRTYPGYSPGPGISYFLNSELAQQYSETVGVLPHLFGFPYIAETLQDSIFRVLVNDDGRPSIGTAFPVYCVINGERKYLAITNKHVACLQSGLRLETAAGDAIPHRSIHLSDEHDIAAIVLGEFPPCQSLFLRIDASVLEDVVSFGYPAVATTNAAYLLVHKGEINAFVESYHDKQTYIIFSAKTHPGNSGGPLVDSCGNVVGVVTSDFLNKPNSRTVDTCRTSRQFLHQSYIVSLQTKLSRSL